MTDFDGMRDAGKHHFEYALTAYGTPFTESSIVEDAESYNAGVLTASGLLKLPYTPEIKSNNIRMTAVKRAEENNALIIRLAEFRGKTGNAKVSLPQGFDKAGKVNLLEREEKPLTAANGRVELILTPWEIATIKLYK